MNVQTSEYNSIFRDQVYFIFNKKIEHHSQTKFYDGVRQQHNFEKLPYCIKSESTQLKTLCTINNNKVQTPAIIDNYLKNTKLSS